MAVISESSSSSPSPSAITSTDPPIDHQSTDAITDQLNSLTLQPENDVEVSTDNNGDLDEAKSEERESVEDGEEKREDDEFENVIPIEEDEKGEREKSRGSKFPLRPEAEDCSFYLRTGMCKFGMNCKFNHPLNNKIKGAKVKGKQESVDGATLMVKDKDDSVNNEGKIDCKYFDRPGGCKFGKACKFNHNRKSPPTLELNFMGLPLRRGEKECPYYMRNGSCKFGANCRFNHPDPTSLGGPDALSGYSNGAQSLISANTSQSTLAHWSPPAALSESPPYVPLIFPASQGVPSGPEWNAYQAPIYPPERSMHLPPAYAMNSPSLERNIYRHQQEQTLIDEFPERPGQPECSYFLKTGNCKYRSACKFHHPKSEIAKSPPCTLSDLGLPLRPGESVCSYYNRYGICKYGPACKYDHPVNHAHSAPLGVSAVDQNPVLGSSLINSQALAAGS